MQYATQLFQSDSNPRNAIFQELIKLKSFEIASKSFLILIVILTRWNGYLRKFFTLKFVKMKERQCVG